MKFNDFLANLEQKDKFELRNGIYYFKDSGIEYEFSEDEYEKGNFKYDILNEEYKEFINRFRTNYTDLGFNEKTKFKPSGMYFSERDSIFNPPRNKHLNRCNCDRFHSSGDCLKKPDLAKGDPKNIKTIEKRSRNFDMPDYSSSSDTLI